MVVCKLWGIVSSTICLGRAKISDEMLLSVRFSNTKIRRPLVACIFGAGVTELHDGSHCREIFISYPLAFLLWVVLTILCIGYNVGQGVDTFIGLRPAAMSMSKYC
jgi:hypothetical protein